MPFWGLVITSIGFAVPTLIAFHKKNWLSTASCGVITLTSVAYHGSVHPIAKTIDMLFAHVIGTGWTIESLRRVIFFRHSTDLVVCMMTVGSVILYWTKSRNNFSNSSKLWHMSFHGLCQGAWCMYLLAS